MRRLGAHKAELRTEALDEGLVQRRIGAVVETEHLVLQPFDALLIGAAERSQGPRRFPAHVVERDDDRKVQTRPR